MKQFSLFALAAAAVSAHAQIAFSSLAPDDTYSSFGYSSGHSSTTTNWRQSFRFQSGASGIIDEVRFAVAHFSGADLVRTRIYTDNAGEPGDTLVIGFQDSVGVGPPGTIETFSNLASSNKSLNAGDWYWFEFYTITSDGFHGYYFNDEGITLDRRASNDGDRTWEISESGVTGPAFEVAVVPEPATMAVLGLGAAALIRRRKK